MLCYEMPAFNAPLVFSKVGNNISAAGAFCFLQAYKNHVFMKIIKDTTIYPPQSFFYVKCTRTSCFMKNNNNRNMILRPESLYPWQNEYVSLLLHIYIYIYIGIYIYMYIFIYLLYLFIFYFNFV